MNIYKIRTMFKDYTFRSFLTSSFSLFITIAFSLYNAFLGIFHYSLWNGSIAIYYLLLVLLRSIIIAKEKRIRHYPEDKKQELRIKMFFFNSCVLILLNLSLIIPISMMVVNARAIQTGLIPAIAMAAYTTYKITFASINFKKTRKNTNISLKFLRTINFIDAFVSILTLQNTLILVNDGYTQDMITLSAISSFMILIVIILISVLSLINSFKLNHR